MMGSTKGSRLGACAVGMTLVMGLAACAESADLDLAPLLERGYHEVTLRAGRADPAADGPPPRWR